MADEATNYNANPILLHRSRCKLYLYSAAFVLAVVIVALTLLTYLHEQVITQLEKNTQSIVRTLELTFNAQIDAIDVGLIAAAHELDEHNLSSSHEPNAINDYLGLIQSSMPNTEIIRATNEHGDIIYGQDIPAGMFNIADRDYFQQLKSNPFAGLLILNPLFGKIEGKWVWSFARRINHSDGSFKGVVYARLDIPRIEALFRQINLDSSGVLSIRDKDLGLISRYRFDGKNSVPTGDKTYSENFLNELKVNPEEGTYSVPSQQSIDGISRLYSYRISKKYGFFVSSGQSLDLALADWRKQVWGASALVAMMTMAVAYIVNLIQKSWALEALEVEKQAEIDEQIRQIAFLDPLTQLTNRRLLNNRLSQTIAASKRSGAYGALMFLDLDNFKPLNDNYGHDVGDLLLIEVGKRLTQCIREVDTIARFGGDEFVVLLNELGSQEGAAISVANQVAEKFRIALGQPYLLHAAHEGQTPITVEHRCTVSIGVTVFAGDGAKNREDILKQADESMYHAKHAGRNCVRFYPDIAIA